MNWFNRVMALIMLLTAGIIIITIYLNSQTISLEQPEEMSDTFLFDKPLKKVILEYENPGRRNLEVNEYDEYLGTRISLAEYDFTIDAEVSSVTYEFEISDDLLREKDVNPESVELFTVLNGTLVPAGGTKENNTITITTRELIPLLLLGEPNEVERISEEELYANSKSSLDVVASNIEDAVKDPRKLLIIVFVFVGMLMTMFLIVRERNKMPEKGDKDTDIMHYVNEMKEEGLGDEEIIANLIERGIKPSHASVLVGKR